VLDVHRLRITPQNTKISWFEACMPLSREGKVYNTKMQQKKRNDLAKRSRYYQSMIDTSLLEPGIPSYNLLKDSYIIMITPFDLFGYGKYQYTFVPICQEEPGCILEDGAVRIFLNTRGTNPEEVSQELVDLLHYLEHTTDEEAEKTDSQRIRRIHSHVCKVKSSEEIGVKYMQAWEEKYYEREEGREEGIKEGMERGRKLKLQEIVKKKLAKNQSPEEIAEALEEPVEVI
ncbi:MAG: Rpn family recombination-promoting nuclease/putative transposase, partial [Blautia sp.]